MVIEFPLWIAQQHLRKIGVLLISIQQFQNSPNIEPTIFESLNKVTKRPNIEDPASTQQLLA